MRDVTQTTIDLVSRPSVTPKDEGCQDYMSAILGPLGFERENLVFHDTTNMWSRRGTKAPLFCFAGHTDVVPTGPSNKWKYPPFEPTIEDGFIYGRGTADMKGSLAAMLCATEQFVKDYPQHKGSIAYLITSDEEGPFINGTTRVIDTLEERNEKIDYCIVGEPSSTERTGDVIKNGRRGSLTGDLQVKGIQGHVAYPHLVKNPIHAIAPALAELARTQWDTGNDYFPPTSFQVSNIHAGTGAGNVVPGTIDVCFNFRFSTELSNEILIAKVEEILARHELDFHIDWTFNGQPFLTDSGTLVEAAVESIKSVSGIDAELSTAGGTSDGRFIAPTGAQVIELGPENATIHKLDEKVKISNLESLVSIYYEILKKCLT
ncbi:MULTISPECIES: succinyl-diaminopimelate desuccinylase [Alteromonadaceae]|jgi:succinyl-diaminopimelate desuccinylase|uniref:Succinyl-diaminopimelate desuccinylase n=1 Tax=Brumicola blandensis TaxID=3075611 RepID=A0AAW8QZA0_9ALTE|nr:MULTISPECIES: succinyl-diaminopimelate desuccinylase [unclassified Alteromonas]MDT0581287.1 succinyl-diaminopimelate desuccinylase [Alteromonas sp. W409]MDT0626915.1 succinyl-diaminopimelate desuccinylase [Alteromonas sp. W364]